MNIKDQPTIPLFQLPTCLNWYHQLTTLGLTRFIDSVIYYYNQDIKYRSYHNYNHAVSVMEALYKLSDTVETGLLLAALYHDSYYTGKNTAGLNELKSAQILQIELMADATQPYLIHSYGYACELIRNTTVEVHLTNRRIHDPLLAKLLDADLSGFALTYDRFLDNQKNILLENQLTIRKSNLYKLGKWLEKFLNNRDMIYHTDKGRELFEEHARSNIERLVLENQPLTSKKKL